MKHIDQQYEKELTELKDKILQAGAIVEMMIFHCMQALTERNNNIAESVIDKDTYVDQLEMEIDSCCLNLLALRQPAASDLRFIAIGLKISKDLERMGDLAVNISEHAIALNLEEQLKPYLDLPQMADHVQKMVKSALDAFVNRDTLVARQVCERDVLVDELNKKISAELLIIMQNHQDAIARGVELIHICRHLERVADHATNIAEQVIFMVEGLDIRHGQKS